jgi:chemotaxis protein MotA
MLGIVGLVVLFGCVFGSYIVSGGSMEPLIEAIPFEMWTIGGAAVATMLMANSMHDVKHTAGMFGKIFKGAAYHKPDYVELLSLLYFLVRLASTKGAMALESHIEKPADSPAFQKFPKILGNHHACTIICDYLRMVGMNADDPNQIEDVMARELKKILTEELHPSHILQNMADALPALGIVAAVLGVIKTMSHIDQPPAVLGAMIGGALVGTFLGILISYGFLNPLVVTMTLAGQAEMGFFKALTTAVVGFANGMAPIMAVEVARRGLPSETGTSTRRGPCTASRSATTPPASTRCAGWPGSRWPLATWRPRAPRISP